MGKEVDKGVKKKDIALKFDIPPNSLSTIIKNRDKLQNYDSSNSCSKHFRTCGYEDVEEAVLKWIHTMKDKNVPISGPFVIEKALQFAKALGYDQFLDRTIHNSFAKAGFFVCSESSEDEDDIPLEEMDTAKGKTRNNRFCAA
ncbi:tigger transposable element-derived protein 4 [Nephila pilipes]|uniref:Tigger transposable element-derived protein 4 n=1 Tax=Nephila pilipes TaxID=299642 RepID=A0A8X6U0S5_NEPPI|nr:tigger transposable element-derived protein 4 [Nephila pilipes]